MEAYHVPKFIYFMELGDGDAPGMCFERVISGKRLMLITSESQKELQKVLGT